MIIPPPLCADRGYSRPVLATKLTALLTCLRSGICVPRFACLAQAEKPPRHLLTCKCQGRSLGLQGVLVYRALPLWTAALAASLLSTRIRLPLHLCARLLRGLSAPLRVLLGLLL